ncbi:hypothetical protein KY362_06045 [Candidatus Woesearchaeota archaeon]|nr:hypothetical protein [Candidatus Woesearchaeota archaeon]
MYCRKVTKLGGTSADSPEDIDRMEQMARDGTGIFVMSAPAGVTTLLIDSYETQDLEEREQYKEQVLAKFRTTHPKADLTPMKKYLDDLLREPQLTEAQKAAVRSVGERFNPYFAAEHHGWEFVNPLEIFFMNPPYDNATIQRRSHKAIRESMSNPNKIYVTGGYCGSLKTTKIATISRGGSDVSAAEVAAALGLDYDNCTDVCGVYEADPRIVPAARKITLLTTKEMRDLSYSGAKIFHPDAILPIERRMREGKALTVHIRSADQYPLEGTFIVGTRTGDPCRPVVGSAYADPFCCYDIELGGLNRLVGMMSKISDIFRLNKLSIEHVTTGIDDTSVILRQDQFKRDRNLASKVKAELTALVGNAGSVGYNHNLGCLVIAGQGIRNCSASVSRRLYQALESVDVEDEFSDKGPRKSCAIVGVKMKDKEKAVNAVHDEFFGKAT